MTQQFKRSIGTLDLLLTSINCMIGGGWLMVAYICAVTAGPASIISWAISALMIATIAFCFSELSTTFPVAGGIARYSHFSHGSSISFGMSLLAWLSCVACAPTEVQVIIQHLTPYYPDGLPEIVNHIDGAIRLTYFGLGLAIVLLGLMTWVNIAGIHILMRLSSSIAMWKLAFPLITIVMIVYTRFEPSNFTEHGFMPGGWQAVLEQTTTCIFAFLGFREATSLASEVEKPAVSIPIAVIGSVGICFILYVSLQIAFIGSVSPYMLKSGWTSLHYPDVSAPMVGIVKSLGLLWLSATISADSIISPFGTGLSYCATSSRLVYAIGKNGFAPQGLTYLNIRGVPISALILNFFVGTIMFFTLTAWEDLVKFQTLAMFIAYSVGPISLYSLRTQLPDLNRPFKIPGGYYGCVVIFFVCNLLALWSGWSTFKLVLSALAAGYGALFVYAAIYNKSLLNELASNSSIWILPYFLGIGSISMLSCYGKGLALIPIGLDLIVVLIFSMVILWLAYISRQSNQKCQDIVAHIDQYDFSESI